MLILQAIIKGQLSCWQRWQQFHAARPAFVSKFVTKPRSHTQSACTKNKDSVRMGGLRQVISLSLSTQRQAQIRRKSIFFTTLCLSQHFRSADKDSSLHWPQPVMYACVGAHTHLTWIQPANALVHLHVRSSQARHVCKRKGIIG